MSYIEKSNFARKQVITRFPNSIKPRIRYVFKIINQIIKFLIKLFFNEFNRIQAQNDFHDLKIGDYELAKEFKAKFIFLANKVNIYYGDYF